MQPILIKLLWIKRLLFAKKFVILTEKASTIYVAGKRRRTFKDELATISMRSELVEFHSALKQLISEFDKKVRASNRKRK